MENLLQIALAAAKKGQSYAFATVVDATLKGTPQKAGAKMIVLSDGTLIGTIGGGRNEKAAKDECLKAIKTGKPYMVTYDFFGGEGQSVCGGQIKVFIEPFIGRIKLIICGAGHIALPLSALGKMLNFHVTVIDNRPEFTNKKRFPHVDTIAVGPHAVELAKIPLDAQSCVMIVTQGNEFDFECLQAVITADFGYLGVISSKAKRVKFFNRLRAQNIPQKHLNRVKIPAGLDIGALTPEEIAVSIVSEIISIKRDNIGTAKFKDRTTKG